MSNQMSNREDHPLWDAFVKHLKKAGCVCDTCLTFKWPDFLAGAEAADVEAGRPHSPPPSEA